MFNLRPYQHAIIEGCRAEFRGGNRRPLVVAPTGSGKTVLTAAMMRESTARGLRCGFIVHRIELLEQTAAALASEGVDVAAVVSGVRKAPDAPAHVAMVQTLGRRTAWPAYDVLIVDEAHHAVSPTYRRILDAHAGFVVGLTATPERLDGRGLGDVFDSLVMGPTVRELIDAGHLADYRLLAVPDAFVPRGVRASGGDYRRDELARAMAHNGTTFYGNAVAHYEKHVAPRTMLVYCINREHAHMVTALYRDRGHDAVYCAGDTPAAERRAIIEGFPTGRPRIIVSVDLFGEGLDVKGLTAVQLLRPTKSLAVYLQQVGRALRPNGETAIILDHVNNVMEHGLPCDDRAWSLDAPKRTREAVTSFTVGHCPKCFRVVRGGTETCPECDTTLRKVRKLNAHEADVELKEIKRAELEEKRRRYRDEERGARTLNDLVRIAVERGYKPSWAAIRYGARKRVNPGELMASCHAIAKEYGWEG